MKTCVLSLIVIVILSTGCQSQALQPALPVAATPTLESTRGPDVKPTKPTTPIVATPTLTATPGPNLKLATDKYFKNPAEKWCQDEEFSFGDFSCQIRAANNISGSQTATVLLVSSHPVAHSVAVPDCEQCAIDCRLPTDPDA